MKDPVTDEALTTAFAFACFAAALLIIGGLVTGHPFFGSADAEVTATFVAFQPCATIRQFGPGEAYWHHGVVYECVSGTPDPRHVFSMPVAQ